MQFPIASQIKHSLTFSGVPLKVLTILYTNAQEVSHMSQNGSSARVYYEHEHEHEPLSRQ